MAQQTMGEATTQRKRKGSKDAARTKKEGALNDQLGQALGAAIKAVQTAPGSDDGWDHLESLADSMQRPDEVAAAYRDVLDGQLPADLREKLSRRAVQFHDEWYGDSPEAMDALLTRILDRDPGADWAFERLVMVHTVAEQWDRLLALYDRMLEGITEPTRRKQLLEDAAHTAKDFAHQPGRAVDYLQLQLELEPRNDKVVAAIERLLERQDRWTDLIDLWRRLLADEAEAEARASRLRIAKTYLDHLRSTEPALEELRIVVTESPAHEEACQQLERILAWDGAPVPVRMGALALLRTNYEAADRGADVVVALERALGFADPREQLALHREAGSRLAILARDVEALAHYSQLLRSEPTDADARRQMRQLARRSSLFQPYVDALVAAAEAAEPAQRAALLLESAHLSRQDIGHAEAAIELYGRVLELSDADRSMGLSAAHHLNEMLAAANRPTARLDVLERLAELEDARVVRRAVLGEAGKLAVELDDPDRALRAYARRLEADAGDLDAMDAAIAVLQQYQRWAPLVEALQQRATATSVPQQRRADLVRTARLQAERLQDIQAAISTWLTVRQEFGDEPETVAALDQLMTEATRFGELAGILEQAASTRRHESAALLSRLGEVHHTQLGQPVDATRFYAHALGVEPTDARARAGLRDLLRFEQCARAAVSALVTAYRATDDWTGLLEIVEPRLDVAITMRDKVEVLRESAFGYEHRSQDLESAQACIGRALSFDPDNPGLEFELQRLATATGGWGQAADAFAVAASYATSPERGSALRMREGEIRQEYLDDAQGAVTAFVEAANLTPGSLPVQRAIVRASTAAGRWPEACRAALSVCAARELVDEDSIGTIDATCDRLGAWDQMVPAMEHALQTDPQTPVLTRAIETLCARWHRDHRKDPEAAEAAALRAVSHDPHRFDTLELLAELQRRRPDVALAHTLLRLDGLTDRDLDALREAAEIAVQQGQSDVNWTRETLIRLFRKSARLFARNEAVIGEQQPPECALWATDRIVDLEVAADRREQAIRALLDASELPFQRAQVHQLRIRAARLCVAEGDRGRAIDLLRSVVEERGDDVALVRELADLCQQEERLLELVTMRRRELELTEDVTRRLALRLQLSELTGKLEKRGGRVESLQENLAEHPGHVASVEALREVMSDKGRFGDLADILAAQALKLEKSNQPKRAAELWSMAATLVEERFSDLGRAVDALEHEVALVPTERALDNLARLHLLRDQPDKAAAVLEQRLQMTDASQRVPVLLRLARAHMQAEDDHAAIRSLELAFEEAPRSGEVRKLLLRLYRDHEMWEPLGRALSRATEHMTDNDTVLAYAHEAAELYADRLGTPELAVPVLERAFAIDGGDRELRSRLAEGLRMAGRLTEARELLLGLVADFGRRRSVERAAIHLQLARVATAQGNPDEAIDQLELASQMDAANPTILRTLAETARDAGQLDRAERAYRALLLQVRRQEVNVAQADAMGPARVLMELSRIAASRGNDEQAEELVESALEALTANDDEGPGLQAALRERAQWGLLRRVLDTRMKHAETPKRRAEILSDVAELHEREDHDDEAALQARLDALRSDAGTPRYHELAIELATRVGQLDRYVATVEDLLDKARRSTDLYVRCELLLRLSEVLETNKDYLRATELLVQAEETGVREVDVWRARARLAATTGNTEVQVAYLERLATLGATAGETRADALYRMAEVCLAAQDTAARGIATLGEALESDPRWELAARLLRRAVEGGIVHPELIDLFERAARKQGDAASLLLALERRATERDVTPEQVREAVDLANKLDQPERAEALMVRAVEVGSSLLDGQERLGWALIGLARRRKDVGDLAGAVKWLCQAVEAGDLSEPVLSMSAEVAAVSEHEGGDLTLAVALYEAILERDPSTRQAWQPLASLYRKLGDLDRLQRLVEETLDSLDDADERNALRLELAQTLMNEPEREQDAIEALRNILLEAPDHPRAQALMADLLERTGKEEDLVELLRQQFMVAQQSGEPSRIASAALRLARRLEASDRQAALETLDMALAAAPSDAGLLRTILELIGEYDPARFADLAERLISLEQGDEAAKLALRLAALHAQTKNEEGELRALLLGYQRAPSSEPIRSRLEQAYERRGDFRGLAQMLVASAEGMSDPAGKVAVLRQAAKIHREMLVDSEGSAAILEQAHQVAPTDVQLALELVGTWAAAGKLERASKLIGRLLEQSDLDERARLELLSTRADLRAAAGDVEGTVTDLEAALKEDPINVPPRLIAALERWRSLAAERKDFDAERTATMRLVELLVSQFEREQARALLTEWVEVQRKDVESLQMLRDLDAADRRWDAVAKTSARLVAVTHGDAQIEAALSLAQACREMGHPEEARPGLEHARRKQPENKEIRAELRRIYEEIGAEKELTKLLAAEADEIEDPQERITLLRRVAQLHLAQGDAESALPILQRILEQHPDDSEAIQGLIDAYLSVGALDLADALIDRMIGEAKNRRTPELAVHYHRKSKIAALRGNTDEQLVQLQQAFASDKNNGQVAADLADLAEAQQNWDLAVRVLRTITLLDAPCPISRPHAFLRQARIAFKKGDAQRAVLWARKAKHESPDDPEIAAFLGQLGES